MHHHYGKRVYLSAWERDTAQQLLAVGWHPAKVARALHRARRLLRAEGVS